MRILQKGNKESGEIVGVDLGTSAAGAYDIPKIKAALGIGGDLFNDENFDIGALRQTKSVKIMRLGSKRNMVITDSIRVGSQNYGDVVAYGILFNALGPDGKDGEILHNATQKIALKYSGFAGGWDSQRFWFVISGERALWGSTAFERALADCGLCIGVTTNLRPSLFILMEKSLNQAIINRIAAHYEIGLFFSGCA